MNFNFYLLFLTYSSIKKVLCQKKYAEIYFLFNKIIVDSILKEMYICPMKHIVFLFLFCFFATFSQASTDDEPFQSYLCQNGNAGTWTNACSCVSGYSGAYCDEEGIPCEEKTIGMYSNKGLCYKAISYAPISYQDKTFYISRSLMNFDDGQDFCKALNARMATRSDLNCFGEGVGCVSVEALILFQEKTYSRGFVWLGRHPNLKDAYYMDINDGVVYYSNADSSAVTQALCVKDSEGDI